MLNAFYAGVCTCCPSWLRCGCECLCLSIYIYLYGRGHDFSAFSSFTFDDVTMRAVNMEFNILYKLFRGSRNVCSVCIFSLRFLFISFQLKSSHFTLGFVFTKCWSVFFFIISTAKKSHH